MTHLITIERLSAATWQRVAITLLGLSVALAALAVHVGLRTPPEQPIVIGDVPDWENLISTGHVIGNPEAEWRIVEFSDFQCKYCAAVRTPLAELIRRYPDRIAVVYRHFPLTSVHQHALAAALAAECAAEQDRFVAFHDVVFQHQRSIGRLPWVDLAATSGVADLEAFAQCMREARYIESIMRDLRDGARIGVTATPRFVFKGRLLRGVAAVDTLAAWIGVAVH